MNNAGYTFIFWCITATTLSLTTGFNNYYTIRTSPPTTTKLQVLWDLKNIKIDAAAEGVIDFPTPPQRTEIKKEAQKRKNRKQLPSVSLSDDETYGPWSDETFQTVMKKLADFEMIELRNICLTNHRDTNQHAKWFCDEMEEFIYNESLSDAQTEEEMPFLPIAVIHTKGHTALIYAPTLAVDHPGKYKLRTSVGQKNVWTAKLKVERDSRGWPVTNGMKKVN